MHRERRAAEGQWARHETEHGRVHAKICRQPGRRRGHVRVPHRWWCPETRRRLGLAGAFVSSDAVLTADTDDLLDREQGIPHFIGHPGHPGRLAPCDPPAGTSNTTLRG